MRVFLYNKTGRKEFSLTGDSTSSKDENYATTENSQKAIGGHQIWNSMDVKVSGSKMKINLTVHELDRYNFNRGEQDIATGTKDEVNGRFEMAGWAKSFITRGTVSRTITIDLDKFDANSENLKKKGVTVR